ncbi:MAG: hypothetical protein HQK55_16330 [Deltaproteobacteria bacterium]|nr:hypothetical protein [Deltaproteobacteria bacterium]
MEKLRYDRTRFVSLAETLLESASKGAPQAYFVKDVLIALMSHSYWSCALLLLENGTSYWCFREGYNHLLFDEAPAEYTAAKVANRAKLALPPVVAELLAVVRGSVPAAINGRACFRLPLKVNEQPIGLLVLSEGSRTRSSPEDQDYWEDVRRALEFAFQSWQNRWTLQERVKEMTCLYGLSRIFESSGKNLFDQLKELAALLPPAMLYADIASAQIVFDDWKISTPGFRRGRPVLQADVLVRGVRRGRIKIKYAREKPELDEGPFLKEERQLLDLVARELSWAIERQILEQERSEMLEQFRQADRSSLLGQLAGYVAHEVNEPLTTILGFAQLALKASGLPSGATDDLHKIVAAAMHAREIIRKPLSITGNTPLHEGALSLNKAVQDIANLFRHRCAGKDIKLEVNLTPNLPPIEAAPSHLRQIVSNLVLNAIQASSPGKSITLITGREEGSNVCLIVKDTGAGMTEEVLKQVFTPFFTTKPKGQGTGLGLPVVKDLVTAQGGEITIESLPGQGTTIRIGWPTTSGASGRV